MFFWPKMQIYCRPQNSGNQTIYAILPNLQIDSTKSPNAPLTASKEMKLLNKCLWTFKVNISGRDWGAKEAHFDVFSPHNTMFYCFSEKLVNHFDGLWFPIYTRSSKLLSHHKIFTRLFVS